MLYLPFAWVAAAETPARYYETEQPYAKGAFAKFVDMTPKESVQRNCTTAQENAPRTKETAQCRHFEKQPTDPQNGKPRRKRKKGSTNQDLREKLEDAKRLISAYQMQVENMQRENYAVAALAEKWKTAAEARKMPIDTQQGGGIAQAVKNEMQVCRKLNELDQACRIYTNNEFAGLSEKDMRVFYDRHFLPHIAALHGEIMRFTGGKVADVLLCD